MWTDTEIRYIEKNFVSISNKLLSGYLHKTIRAVREKAYQLKLYKNGRSHGFRQDIKNLDLKYLYELGLSSNEIAEKLKCSQSLIEYRLQKINFLLRNRNESLILIHKKKDFGFKKGFQSWNKGLKIQTNTGRTHFKKGQHCLTEFKKGDISWNKGLTESDERVKIMSEKSSETQRKLYAEGKLVPWNKDKKTGFLSKNPEETKAKISKSNKETYKNGRVSYFKGRYGKLHPRYKGKNCKKRQKRNDPAYANWVARVKRRDKNICQLKDENCSGYNIVHHIKGWAKYSELRYKINNGITLCQFHHPLKREDEKKFIPIFMELVRQKN